MQVPSLLNFLSKFSFIFLSRYYFSIVNEFLFFYESGFRKFKRNFPFSILLGFFFFYRYKNNKCAFTIFGKNSIFFSCFFFLKNLLPFHFSIFEKFKIKKFSSPLIINSRLLFFISYKMFHFTNFFLQNYLLIL